MCTFLGLCYYFYAFFSIIILLNLFTFNKLFFSFLLLNLFFLFSSSAFNNLLKNDDLARSEFCVFIYYFVVGLFLINVLKLNSFFYIICRNLCSGSKKENVLLIQNFLLLNFCGKEKFISCSYVFLLDCTEQAME